MYDWIIDSVHGFIKNGVSWASLAGVLLLSLKNRNLKRYINRNLPRMLRDRDEDKLDHIIRLLEAMPCVSSDQSRSLPSNVKRSSLEPLQERSAARSAGKFTIYHTMERMKKTMKEYLKKLTRTKFQAFLIVTITNLILLIGQMTGHIDLGDKVNEWMPAINLVVQLIATAVYQWVEGSIDKEAQKQNVYVMKPDPLPPAEPDPSQLPFDGTKLS